jgi:2-polyprenyl-3-methyl-5-hydroxy-6-metoxy-1,4-benzoquinol methylase
MTKRLGPGRPMNLVLTPEWKLCVDDSGSNRYKRKQGMYEPVKRCPVCRSKRRQHLVSRFGLDIYRCTNCTHGYMDPRIKYKEIHKIYWHDKTAEDIYTTPMQVKIDKIKYNYGLRLAETYGLPSKGRILDIGCGTGLFLKQAKRFGFKDCVGIDPNKLYIKLYKNMKGIKFYSTDFESLELDELGGNFDCMSMWSVMEHIYDPVKFFTRMNKLMKKSGIFLVFTPNTNALSTRLFRDQSPIFVWKHVSFWTADSLKLFMEKMGYKVQLIETVISEIGNIRNYLAWDHQYAGSHETDTTFEFITPQFIHKHLMGSRLLGVFKKL